MADLRVEKGQGRWRAEGRGGGLGTSAFRAALALVSHQEAPLGIVYQTDAVIDQGVDIVGTFPASSHPPIIYPLAVIKDSINPTAESYIEFLQSHAVVPVFELRGFAMLR